MLSLKCNRTADPFPQLSSLLYNLIRSSWVFSCEIWSCTGYECRARQAVVLHTNKVWSSSSGWIKVCGLSCAFYPCFWEAHVIMRTEGISTDSLDTKSLWAYAVSDFIFILSSFFSYVWKMKLFQFHTAPPLLETWRMNFHCLYLLLTRHYKQIIWLLAKFHCSS